MTATEIVREIGRRGGRLIREADRLFVEPPGALDDRLREAIRRCRPALFAILDGQNVPANPAKPLPLPNTAGIAGTFPPSAPVISVPTTPAMGWDWLVGMPTERFVSGNYIVTLWSEVLQEKIALISHWRLKARTNAMRLTAYLPCEIKELADNPVDTELLKKVHAIKKRFTGDVSGTDTPQKPVTE